MKKVGLCLLPVLILLLLCGCGKTGKADGISYYINEDQHAVVTG